MQAGMVTCLVSFKNQLHISRSRTRYFLLPDSPPSFNKTFKLYQSHEEDIGSKSGAEEVNFLLQWNGTVLSTIYPTMLVFMAFATMVVILADHTDIYLPAGDKLTPILTLVIGQLLAFRTSTAYERWDEGRLAEL